MPADSKPPAFGPPYRHVEPHFDCGPSLRQRIAEAEMDLPSADFLILKTRPEGVRTAPPALPPKPKRKPGPPPLPGTEHLDVKARQQISDARRRIRESEAVLRDKVARGKPRDIQIAQGWVRGRQQHLEAVLRRHGVRPEALTNGDHK